MIDSSDDKDKRKHGKPALQGFTYLAKVFAVFGALVILSAVLTISGKERPPGPYASVSTHYIYYFIERKLQAAQRIHNGGSALALIGGSSSLYSVRAAQIERTLGIPTFNWGTHAGLGLNYLLFNARRVLKRGDVAILFLEYDHYFVTEPQWTLADYVIPNDFAYLQSLGAEKALSVTKLLTLEEYWQRMIDSMSPRDPLAGAAILESINDNGDLIVNHKSEQKDFHRASLDKEGVLAVTVTRREQLEIIADFISWCKTHGVQVVTGFPPFLDNPYYHEEPATSFFATIERFYHELGVPTLGSPHEYFFEKPLFFDTRYHLNAEGAKVMTGKIINHLAGLINSHDKVTFPGPATIESATRNKVLNVDFSAAGYPGFIDKVSGLSVKEDWGRWTEGPHMELYFTENLPRRFTLEISINSAFAQNAEKPVTVRIGKIQQKFMASEKDSIVQLVFDLDFDDNLIVVTPPSPISPAELGLSEDTRRFGIGLKKIRILNHENLVTKRNTYE